MSRLRKIATNTIIQMTGRVIGTLFGVFTIAVMTRALGADGYGQYTLAFTFLAVAGAIVDFGFTLTTTQMISEKHADESRIVSNAMTLRIISGVFFFGLAAVVGFMMPYEPIVKITIAIGTFSFFFMTLSQMFMGVFQKHLSMWRPAVAEAVSRGIILGLVIYLATQGASVAHMMGAFGIGNAIMALINIGFASKLTRIRLMFETKMVKTFVSRSWPIAISIFFNLLYLKGDIIFLSFYRSDAEIGLYGAAYKVLDVIAVIPTMFMGLILPMLVGAWTAHKKNDFYKLLQQAFDLFGLLAFPILGGTMILAGPLMALVAGDEFLASGTYLAILMLANTVVFFGILSAHTVVALNKQKAILPAYFFTAIVAIVLYLITIPRFGAYGAAWTTLISEILIASLTTYMVVRVSKFIPKLRNTGIYLLSTIAMTSLGFLYMLSLDALTILNIVGIIAVSGVFYAGSVIALGGIKLNTIKEILGRT